MPSYGGLLLSPCRPPLLLLVLLLVALPADPADGATPASPWKTLSGNIPAIVAKGGYSGIFPDSSYYAFTDVLQLRNLTFWCDVQLTKDAVGICLPNVNLANCTDVALPNSPFINKKIKYVINGREVVGYFPVDFNYSQIALLNVTRSIWSRTPVFDSLSSVLPVEFVANYTKVVWLNIQHDVFYKQHNLNITKCIMDVSTTFPVSYISSPEVNFLRNIASTFNGSKTKLIFCIPEDETTDPSTNQTYDSLLKNLTFIRTFASGILIPKSRIWPVTSDLYLEQQTTIVTDAHTAKLEVFASGFVNDAIIPYNYSYNPVSEYLNFIDNGDFSVDGLLSDFPSTAMEAISCFSHLGSNANISRTPVVISHNGDSGNYPSCTDLAYTSAIDGGADVIDCNVQITKDSILICLSSADLQDSTTVTKSPFGTRLSTIPEILAGPGIFSFNLTWDDIQNSLKPAISNPFLRDGFPLFRNPQNKNAGKFVTLSDFLNLAKNSNATAVMITVENAHFLVEKLGYDIVGNVIAALDDAGYNQTSPTVMIQSPNSSTLISFKEKQKTKYKMVYRLDELVGDVENAALIELRKFADAVAVSKGSIFLNTRSFITNQTKIVSTLRSSNFDVYVYLLRNEFVSSYWDFFSDAIYEIFNFVQGANVSGVITDFPATSHLYRRSTCDGGVGVDLIPPGFLAGLAYFNLSIPPLPSLKPSDIKEKPLPAVTAKSPPNSTETPTQSASARSNVASLLLTLLTTLVWLLLFTES